MITIEEKVIFFIISNAVQPTHISSSNCMMSAIYTEVINSPDPKLEYRQVSNIRRTLAGN